MFRVRAARPKFVLGLFGYNLFENEYDITKEYEELVPKGRGIEGVKRIFYKTPNGGLTQELRSISDATATGFVLGGLVGGMLKMASQPEKFAYENMATKFASHLDAARAMQHKVLIAFLQGALHIGWRASLFFCMFQATATLLYAYTGEFKATQYMYAGGLTGMLYKFQSGPKAAVSGAVFGSALGLLGGGALKGMLYLSGMSLEQIYRERAATVNAEELKHHQAGADRSLKPIKEVHETLVTSRE